MYVKIKIYILLDPEIKVPDYKLMYKDVISVALIVVAENRKQPVCSSIEE